MKQVFFVIIAPMYHLKLSAITLFLLLILLYLHTCGIAYHLYVTYWFYDIILHFLGGVCIALSIVCVSEFFGIKVINNNLWNIIWLALLGGVAWELFEVYYDIAGSPTGTLAYKLDTAKDLFMDTLGAFVVWLLI